VTDPTNKIEYEKTDADLSAVTKVGPAANSKVPKSARSPPPAGTAAAGSAASIAGERDVRWRS
jgi:hypothetical protein